MKLAGIAAIHGIWEGNSAVVSGAAHGTEFTIPCMYVDEETRFMCVLLQNSSYGAVYVRDPNPVQFTISRTVVQAKSRKLGVSYHFIP